MEERIRRATGRPSVNVAQVWKFFTTSVYASGDLPVIAAREALQNSVDAIRAAIRARQIKESEGRFEVTWDPSTRSLTFEDNGIGMDADTILTKFLSLGDSGKSSAAGSEEAAGGFGVAKAVILGVSATFSWEMHTQDNRVLSTSSGEVEIFEGPFRQGTRLVLRDVPQQYSTWYDPNLDASIPLVERLRELLGANDLPQVTLLLDGNRVSPLFSRRAGSRISVGTWGANVQATIKLYRRPPGDRGGGYYIRLGGLLQHKKPAQRTSLPADCVVDLSTSIRPGQSGYPLNASRDELQYPARDAFYDLVREVEQEAESAGADLEDEVFLPDTQGGKEIADLAEQALQAPEVRSTLQRAARGVADYLGARSAETPTVPAADSNAAPFPTVGLQTPMAQGPELIQQILEAHGPLPSEVQQALARAEKGPLGDRDAEVLDAALKEVSQSALGPNGGGLLQAVGISPAYSALDTLRSQTSPRRSPFGAFAGLRISRVNYDRKKARRFLKAYSKWIPHLVCWDQTLRLVAREGGIRRSFRPGFVLNDRVTGLVATEQSTAVVYIHPDFFATLINAHHERPIAIAVSLHQLACHELAHLDGRMGEGHGESFLVAREELGRRTAHLVEPLAAFLVEVLGLAPKVKPSRSRPPRQPAPPTWVQRALQITSNAVVRYLLQTDPGRIAQRLRDG